jgi:hypothetical protein
MRKEVIAGTSRAYKIQRGIDSISNQPVLVYTLVLLCSVLFFKLFSHLHLGGNSRCRRLPGSAVAVGSWGIIGERAWRQL